MPYNAADNMHLFKTCFFFENMKVFQNQNQIKKKAAYITKDTTTQSYNHLDLNGLGFKRIPD